MSCLLRSPRGRVVCVDESASRDRISKADRSLRLLTDQHRGKVEVHAVVNVLHHRSSCAQGCVALLGGTQTECFRDPDLHIIHAKLPVWPPARLQRAGASACRQRALRMEPAARQHGQDVVGQTVEVNTTQLTTSRLAHTPVASQQPR